MATETKTKTRQPNDCDACVYLGPYGKNDLYVCVNLCNEIKTVIGIYGPGADYISGTALVPHYPALYEALERAKALGFKTKN